MANGSIITDDGILISLDRTFLASPTYTAPSQFKVGTGTTTPTVSDTDLVTPVTIDVDDFKDFESGYPIIDETNFQATIRCFLNTLEANGNNLTEFGLFNSDGTELMFSRSVFDSINKTNLIQISIVETENYQ